MSRKLRKPPQDQAEQQQQQKQKSGLCPREGAVKEESFVNLGKTLHHGEITLDRGRISALKEGRPSCWEFWRQEEKE